MLVNSLNL